MTPRSPGLPTSFPRGYPLEGLWGYWVGSWFAAPLHPGLAEPARPAGPCARRLHALCPVERGAGGWPVTSRRLAPDRGGGGEARATATGRAACVLGLLVPEGPRPAGSCSPLCLLSQKTKAPRLKGGPNRGRMPLRLPSAQMALIENKLCPPWAGGSGGSGHTHTLVSRGQRVHSGDVRWLPSHCSSLEQTPHPPSP